MINKLLAGLVLLLTFTPTTDAATMVAYDDAADPAYTAGGPYHALNGGFGFDPWTHSLPAFPAGSGGPLHAYIASSASNDPIGPTLTNIDTAGKAWGNNADPTGNTFTARRNLSSTNALGVGGTYTISMDNSNVDGQETLSWGQGNNVICQFFFNPLNPNYQFKDVLSNTTLVTPIPQDWGGVRLTFTRDTATTYSFSVKRLSDNFTFGVGPFAYDTTNITAIRTLTITNLDGGAGGGHAMFVNAIEATAVPEPTALLGTGVVLGATVVLGRRR
jgi:hypothetical protein